MHSAVTVQRQPHALFTAVCNMRGTDDVAAVAKCRLSAMRVRGAAGRDAKVGARMRVLDTAMTMLVCTWSYRGV